MANEIAVIDDLERRIIEAKTFDEIFSEIVRAKAIEEVLRGNPKSDATLVNKAITVRLIGQRGAGQMILDDPEISAVKLPKGGQRVPLKEKYGIERKTAYRWQVQAQLPEERFRAWVHETIDSKKEELSSAALFRVAVNYLNVKGLKRKRVGPPKGFYSTIVIDPPWPVRKIAREERPLQADNLDYPVMSLKEIMALPVGKLASKDGCHLYLWTTHRYLPFAIKMMTKEWGFKYQCVLTWVKNVGMTPFSWMYSTELVLFGRKGKLDLLRKGLRLDFKADVTRHSEKPEAFYELVKQASPEPRLDMFARKQRAGFTPYGDEI